MQSMKRHTFTSLLAGLIVLGPLLPGAATAAPRYEMVKHVSLKIRTDEPSFVCLNPLKLLDRGRMVYIGRPIKNRSVLVVLDLESLEEKRITIPDIPGTQVPPRDVMAVDRPIFYDTANATAGIILRAGGLVGGDAVYAEWDLERNRISRRLPLAEVGDARWVSARPIGYDHERKECFIEIVRCRTGVEATHHRGRLYELAVLAVADEVRTVVSFDTRLRYTGKSPYFDPIHRRSMHIEYNEHGRSYGYLVDLETGEMKRFALPRVIYGFAFDPDGRTGYVYAEKTGKVFKLDLETGKRGKSKIYGRRGHLLEFVAPGVLLLGRNRAMHFIDAKTLSQKDLLKPSDFHWESAHLEGSIFMPGRALVRIFYELYIVDFPELLNPGAKTQN